MRDVLIFLAVLAIVFFAVGETRGWNVGIPAQTPVFVYKNTGVTSAARRAVSLQSMPVQLRGKVRHGSVTVTIRYQRPNSFQTGAQAGAVRVLFEQTYRVGERIAIDQAFDGGPGDYTVQLTFDEATGFFRLTLPTNSEL